MLTTRQQVVTETLTVNVRRCDKCGAEATYKDALTGWFVVEKMPRPSVGEHPDAKHYCPTCSPIVLAAVDGVKLP